MGERLTLLLRQLVFNSNKLKVAAFFFINSRKQLISVSLLNCSADALSKASFVFVVGKSNVDLRELTLVNDVVFNNLAVIKATESKIEITDSRFALYCPKIHHSFQLQTGNYFSAIATFSRM